MASKGGLKDKIVLITGTSSGIGRALSITFHNYGFKVYATSRQLESMKELKELGIETLELNVRDKDSIDKAVNYIIDIEGRIDILVNNAGLTGCCPASEVPIDLLKEIMETNFYGLVMVCCAVSKHMIEQRKGLIMNIGSISGYIGLPFGSIYSASKSAVHTYTDTLRIELEPFGVKVMTVTPGPIQSVILDKAIVKFEQLLHDNPKSPYNAHGQFILSSKNKFTSMMVSANKFSEDLVNSLFRRRGPPYYFNYGPGSWLLLLLSMLPISISKFIISKSFGFQSLPPKN
ncbi:Oxidoreductase [Tieghemostelium lacteum]|uniref:Oxidoreductase n=1 Tax=Tieghemostelium lacteum TaxID=361077 RepID=A0A151Z776_TIELA|nr:Oxidoreductase [Tieghemostelium lacteum]|eukprot:KYQ89813.1 Oxidoreductase [Tieghemostelium lacteum]